MVCLAMDSTFFCFMSPFFIHLSCIYYEVTSMICFFAGQTSQIDLLLRSIKGLMVPTHLGKHEEVVNLTGKKFLRLRADD